jgi:hypothetical protein
MGIVKIADVFIVLILYTWKYFLLLMFKVDILIPDYLVFESDGWKLQLNLPYLQNYNETLQI